MGTAFKKTESDEDKAARLTWLVAARNRNQDFMLKLFKTKRAEWSEFKVSIYGYVVGITFSLWRAANLIENVRDRDTIYDRAEGALEKLIADNAIGYYQDLQLSSWMSGYYLNNAYLRIKEIREWLAKEKVEIEIIYLEIEKMETLSKTDAFNYWNQLQTVTISIFEKILE